MRPYLLILCAFFIGGVWALHAQTALSGVVTDLDTKEPLIGAQVALYKDGNLVTGTITDWDGSYSINNIDPGTYDVEISYVGYAKNKITGVVIFANKANSLDVEMSQGVNLNEVVVVEHRVELVSKDKTSTGGTLTDENIKRLPVKNINAIVATVAGTSSADEGGAISIKGSRSNATDYYIDGIRVSGNMVPQSEIEQLQVITGGIEAQYGDVTGGIISITTKGPSKRFSGGLELETSQFLDNYGYNLANANISGPIITRKTIGLDGKETKESVLGFRFSGQYWVRKDDDPPATPVYRVKDDVLKQLQDNPLRIFNGTPYPSAQFLNDDDVVALDYNPFEDNTRLDLTAKLDARLSKAIDVTFTGTYNYEKDYFTPSFNPFFGFDPGGWQVYNAQNNPFSLSRRYRGNFRFRHRLGTSGDEESNEEGKGPLVRNASYTLQFGYERLFYNLQDPRHEDRFFDYGYIGNFDYTWEPVFGTPVDPNFPYPLQHRDFRQTFHGYTPGDINPVLANYNKPLEDVETNGIYFADNGFISSNFTSVWGLHTNVGMVYNRYRRRDNTTLTFTANSAFELHPKNGGKHNIQFGVWYEQRTNRGYDLNPFNLWTIARQQANSNIIGVDTTNVVGDTLIFGFDIPIYGKQTIEQEDLLFYQRVRELTGTPLDEYVNVDGLDPSILSLDLFSAKELTNQNILDYWGYDYLGNPIDVSFDDFFTATDANGIRTFPVAANRPIYSAAYIQDRFQLKDIIIRVGVRVDRYDANTKVLKDPYALYEIMSAKDFHDQYGGDRPATIGDDFSVYVESEGSTKVKAYRDGDTWYFANGTQANDGKFIFGGGLVFPKYTVENPNIQSRDFDPSISFKDYEPQVNIMPRLAFSFPISDDANFFAHYDVLVQRPPSNTLATPLDYFYFLTKSDPRNNPNLKPERTVDYEVGFQQKLNQNSAIKLAAYYKELRDMIQVRQYLYVAAPINSYQTYDNLDFGTVKGFTFQYDLRRTGNITLLASYTLQFADGTGSDANSNRSRANQGIQRVLYPLNFDERHRINLSLDYRYGSGKEYNGPRVAGMDIFANAGLNLQAFMVSGRPYTAAVLPNVLDGDGVKGAINGARLPWTLTMNLRIDKDFVLREGGNGKSPMVANVYFRVSNLLNRKNIINVYPFTGSPADDGYLASSRGQDSIESTTFSPEATASYLASYQWAMLNPDNYALPRRMYIGAVFSF